MFNMTDKIIIVLEEKIAYLQNMLDDLNMTVFRQQERIEKLNELVNDMNKNINNSKNARLGESASDKDNPPHY